MDGQTRPGLGEQVGVALELAGRDAVCPLPGVTRDGEVLAHRDYCRDCGFELNPVLAEAGKKVHAGCTDPLDDAPVTTTGRTT